MKKILAFALALAMILTCSLALADRLDDIKAACKGAHFANDMSVQFDSTGGDEMVTLKEDISAWLGKVKKTDNY